MVELPHKTQPFCRTLNTKKACPKLMARYPWKNAAQAVVRLFEESCQRLVGIRPARRDMNALRTLWQRCYLMLGVAKGSLLLAQVMRPSSTAAQLVCDAENPCPPGEVCIKWPEDHGSGTIEKHADGFEF